MVQIGWVRLCGNTCSTGYKLFGTMCKRYMYTCAVVRCLRGTNYLDTMCKRYVAYGVRIGWVLCLNVRMCCRTLSTGFE